MAWLGGATRLALPGGMHSGGSLLMQAGRGWGEAAGSRAGAKAGARLRLLATNTSRRRPSTASPKSAGGLKTAAQGGESDIVVFQCDRDKSAALLTAMTISQAAFLLVLGSIAWELKESATDTDDTDVNHATPDDIPEKAAPGPAINVFTKKDQGGERHYGFAALYGTLGCAFLSLGFFLPRCFVRQMTVLKGGQAVEIQTYALLGTRKLKVPREALKLPSRPAYQLKDDFAGFNIDGYKFRFVLDGKNGRFLDERAFNALQVGSR